MNPILTLEGVSKRFGGLQAIADVSFTVRPRRDRRPHRAERGREDHAVNLLVGLERPDRGSIALEGSVIAGVKAHRIAARGMTKTFQNVALFSEMSVLDTCS